MNRALPAAFAVALLAGAAYLASSTLTQGSSDESATATVSGSVITAPSSPSPLISAPASASASASAPAQSAPAQPEVDRAVLAGAQADASVGDVLASGTATRTLVSTDGRWARLDVTTEFDGLVVVLVNRDGAWQVADAGTTGVGCPVAPSGTLTELGLDCA